MEQLCREIETLKSSSKEEVTRLRFTIEDKVRDSSITERLLQGETRNDVEIATSFPNVGHNLLK